MYLIEYDLPLKRRVAFYQILKRKRGKKEMDIEWSTKSVLLAADAKNMFETVTLIQRYGGKAKVWRADLISQEEINQIMKRKEEEKKYKWYCAFCERFYEKEDEFKEHSVTTEHKVMERMAEQKVETIKKMVEENKLSYQSARGPLHAISLQKQGTRFKARSYTYGDEKILSIWTL